MPPSAKRIANRFAQRCAGFATSTAGGNFHSDEWVAGVRAGKFARDRGHLPNPPDERPTAFYEGYDWGYDNAPTIQEVD